MGYGTCNTVQHNVPVHNASTIMDPVSVDVSVGGGYVRFTHAWVAVIIRIGAMSVVEDPTIS